MSTSTGKPNEIDLRESEPRPMGETLDGYPWLPRMIDKARAAQAGTLGSKVHPCPVDRVCLARLRVDFDKFTGVIRSTSTDEEVLEGLRRLRVATPAQAWFDPIQREAELEREDDPRPGEVIRAGQEFVGLAHGIIGVSYVRVSLDPGAERAAQHHPYDKVVIVEEGRGTATVEGESHQVEAGQTLTLPPRTTHALANTGDGPLRLLELHANGRVIDEAAEHAA